MFHDGSSLGSLSVTIRTIVFVAKYYNIELSLLTHVTCVRTYRPVLLFEHYRQSPVSSVCMRKIFT